MGESITIQFANEQTGMKCMHGTYTRIFQRTVRQLIAAGF